MVLSAVSLIVFFSIPKSPELDLMEVKKTNLLHEISLTGKVKAAESVSLGFERIGRISFVSKSAGDKIFAGEIIASLDNSDLEAELVKAEAAIKSAESDLLETMSGARPEEVNVQKAKVESARQSLDAATRDLADKLGDYYGKTDELIRNKIDRFFYDPKGTYSRLNFNMKNYALANLIETRKKDIERKMLSWKSSSGGVLAEASAAIEALDAIRSLSDSLLIAFGEGIISAVNSQSTMTGWETDTASVRSSASTAASSIVSSKEKYVSFANSLAVEEEQLSFLVSGATSYQIQSSSAKVESARASAKSLKAQIRKGMIISPIKGTIGKMDLKKGEIISAGSAAATVISDKKFQMDVYIPEVDISKVLVGYPANVTLDAYGGDLTFKASVIDIDPGETIIEGITTYKAVLEFISDDNRIRSGMTANIDIIGDGRHDVLAVPQRAVITDDGRKYLNVLKGKNVAKVEVRLGFRGSNGYVEIMEGLNEGDRVVMASSSK